MLSRRGGPLGFVVCLGLALSSIVCEKVPLLAPTGSTITLVANATALPANGSAEITAVVVEGAGTPPHSGTQVTFTTTLGLIQPATATTDVSGQVTVRFLAGTNNGTATIEAISGGATTSTAGAVKIAIGTAAVGAVHVGANPTAVAALGGSTTITANVYDVNGNALPSVPVVFTTSAGSLTSSVVTSDANGAAQTTLTTSQQAVVTASVGAQGSSTGGTTTGGTTTGGTTTTTPTTPTSGQASGTVTVTVNVTPTLVITPPTTPPSVGVPASFTFAVTAVANGAVVRSITVDWGDGRTQSLGAQQTGSSIDSHVYSSAGSYVITATLVDSAGNSTAYMASVTVIPVPRPTILVSQSPNPGHSGTPTTLTIQVTPASGIGVQDVSINFGDGTSADIGGGTSATLQHVYTTTINTTFTVTVTVLDTTGQSSIGNGLVAVTNP